MCTKEEYLERYQREWEELTPEEQEKVRQERKELAEDLQDPTLLEKRLKQK